MTANEIITNLSNTSLVSQGIADLTVPSNVTTLLQLLNMAKDKVAEETLLWLGGEKVTMVTGTSEYTLSSMPIQIVDVFDSNMNLRPRNSVDSMGYYQVSPNKLTFNTIQNGLEININYYETPPDFLIDDEVIINPTLIPALQFYVAHKAFEIYKTESAIFTSVEFYKKYKSAIGDFKSTTDSVDVDTVISMDNKIWKRGIR